MKRSCIESKTGLHWCSFPVLAFQMGVEALPYISAEGCLVHAQQLRGGMRANGVVCKVEVEGGSHKTLLPLPRPVSKGGVTHGLLWAWSDLRARPGAWEIQTVDWGATGEERELRKDWGHSPRGVECWWGNRATLFQAHIQAAAAPPCSSLSQPQASGECFLEPRKMPL